MSFGGVTRISPALGRIAGSRKAEAGTDSTAKKSTLISTGNRMKSQKNIEHTVSSICARHKPIIASYIFGSVVKGKEEPGDIDIAVLLERAHLQSFSIPSLISEFEKAVGCRVDVVVLNRAGEILKYEVRRSGKLIFERSPDIRKRVEIQGRKSYEDFLSLHKRYVRKVLYGEKNG